MHHATWHQSYPDHDIVDDHAVFYRKNIWPGSQSAADLPIIFELYKNQYYVSFY